MARRLNAVVYVDGVAYGPDDDVPAKVAKRIGDHAWVPEPEKASESKADDDAEQGE